jgi:predicted RNA polymerase sigma factor
LLFVCAHPEVDPVMHTPLILQNAESARSGRTDWPAIMLFYKQLLRIKGALGTRGGYAVLESIDPEAVSRYQPYWAVRAHLRQRLGKTRETAEACDRAIGLAEDPAVRESLLQKRG